MSINNPSDTNESASSSGDSRGTTTGWLAALRSRFGLGEASSLREDLEVAVKHDVSGSFSAEERRMLLRLLRFGDSRVEDVMVPRADIIAIEEDAPIAELLQAFEKAGVSRVPIFRDTLDDPRGMVHIKDLLSWLMAQSRDNSTIARTNGADQPSIGGLEVGSPTANPDGDNTAAPDFGAFDLSRPVSMARIKRQVLYVPPSMPAMNLLIKMQSTRIHMALVVDEYGGTDGLVTIEDLVEQIVGDIEDEHDEAEVANILEDPKLGLIASARTPIPELEDRLGRKLLTEAEDEEIDTLGGLVFTIVGRVPARGELVRHHSGVEFEVLDADARRVKTLKIHGVSAAKPETKDSDQDAAGKP